MNAARVIIPGCPEDTFCSAAGYLIWREPNAEETRSVLEVALNSYHKIKTEEQGKYSYEKADIFGGLEKFSYHVDSGGSGNAAFDNSIHMSGKRRAQRESISDYG